jgi:hypothetical protein
MNEVSEHANSQNAKLSCGTALTGLDSGQTGSSEIAYFVQISNRAKRVAACHRAADASRIKHAEPAPLCSGREAASLPILAERFRILAGHAGVAGMASGCSADRYCAAAIVDAICLNYWNRDFFDAIGRKDGAALWTQALRFVPLAAASLMLTIFSVWPA